MLNNRFTASICAVSMLAAMITPLNVFASISAGVQADGSYLIGDFTDSATATAWADSSAASTDKYDTVYKALSLNWSMTDSGGTYLKDNSDLLGDLDFSGYDSIKLEFKMDVASEDISSIDNYLTVVLSTTPDLGNYTTYKKNECLVYELPLSGLALNEKVEVTIPLRKFTTQFDGMADGVQGTADGTTNLSDIKSIGLFGGYSGQFGATDGVPAPEDWTWLFKNSNQNSNMSCGFLLYSMSLFNSGEEIDARAELDNHMSQYDEVNANIKLPTSIAGFNGSIAWASDNPQIISPEGIVTVPGEDTQVILTATITKENGESETAEYIVTVKAKSRLKAGLQSDGSYLIGDFTDQATATAWADSSVKIEDKYDTVYKALSLNWTLTDSGGSYLSDNSDIFGNLDFSEHQSLKMSFVLNKNDNLNVSSINNYLTIVLSTAEELGTYDTYKKNECLVYELPLEKYKLNEQVEAVISLNDFKTQFDGMVDGVKGTADGRTPLSEIKSIALFGGISGQFGASGGVSAPDGWTWLFKNSGQSENMSCGFLLYNMSLFSDDASKVKVALDEHMSQYMNVESDIDLPTELDGTNGSIEWKSDNADIIGDDGTVTIPRLNSIVKLTATITGDDGSTFEAVYSISVKGLAGDGVAEYLYNADLSQFPDGPMTEELNSQLAKLGMTAGFRADGAYDVFFENGALVQRSINEIPAGKQPADGDHIYSNYNLVRDGTRQFYEVCFSSSMKKQIKLAFQAPTGKYNSFMSIDCNTSGVFYVQANAGKDGTPNQLKNFNTKLLPNEKIRVRLLIDTKNDEIDGLWYAKGDGDFIQVNPFGNIGEPFGYSSYMPVETNNRFNQVMVYATGTGAFAPGDEGVRLYYIRCWTDMPSKLELAEEKLNESFDSIIGESGVVRGDIELPSSIAEYPDIKIDWSSSDPSVIDSNGKVVLPENNTEIELKATLGFESAAYADITRKVTYNVLVGGINDEEYVIVNDNFFGGSALNYWDVSSTGGSASIKNGKIVIDKNSDGTLMVKRSLVGADSPFVLNGKVNVKAKIGSENAVSSTYFIDHAGNKSIGMGFLQNAGQEFAYYHKNDTYKANTSSEVETQIELNSENGSADIYHNSGNIANGAGFIDTLSGISEINTVVESGKVSFSQLRVWVPNSKRLELMKEQLTWDSISADSKDNVTYVKLIENMPAGVKVSWTSSDEAIIGTDGTFKRPANDTAIKLVAKLYKAEKPSDFVEKEFDIVVCAADYGNLAYNKAVSTNLTTVSGTISSITDGSVNTGFSGGISKKKGEIVVDLGAKVPVSSVLLSGDNSAIKAFTIDVSSDNSTWTTVHTGDSPDGLIKITPCLARYVRLNITDIKSGGNVNINEFEVRFAATDAECAQADADELTIKSDYVIKSDIELPRTGIFGSSITWESSNDEILSDDGKLLKKPVNDTVVVLKATITRGSAVKTKTFSHVVEGTSNGTVSPGGSGGGGGGGGGGGASGGSIGGGAYFPTDVDSAETPQYESRPTSKVFNDIDNVAWAYESILGLEKAGIVSGNGNGGFEPLRAVKREEFVKMLLLTLDVDMEQTGAELPFSDCEETQWYSDYIAIAYKAGIVKGTSDTEFGIGQPVTRQDMAVMLHRAMETLGYTLPEGEAKVFGDVESISEYALGAVDALSAAGYLNGDEAGCFNPSVFANRAEVAKLLYQLL